MAGELDQPDGKLTRRSSLCKHCCWIFIFFIVEGEGEGEDRRMLESKRSMVATGIKTIKIKK